jgi:3-oxoadipate enol-lactonase
MPFYTSRGLRLHYEAVGEGPAVLFVHGFTNYGMVWAPQLPDLVSAGYRALLPDLAGHGNSAPATAITTVDELARDMIALLDHLDHARATVCGLSLGGMVAQQLATDFPERITGMIVADSRPNADDATTRQAVESWVALFEQPDGPALRLATTWPKLVNEPFRESAAGRAAFAAWNRVLARIPGSSLVNVARGMTRFSVMSRLAALRLPTLVVSGECDELIPTAASRVTADQVAGAAFRVIPRAGHIASLDSPDIFNPLLLTFLAEHAAA